MRISRLFFSFFILILFSLPASADLSVDAELRGGYFQDDRLFRTAGRENQFKLTDAIISFEFKRDDITLVFEAAPLVDELYVDKNDSAYNDVYTNLGTSMYYVGDFPVREAYVQKNFSETQSLAFGRQISSLASRDYDYAKFAPRGDFFLTGIASGLRYQYDNDSTLLSASVLWGRDRPCLGANCYLDGSLDPQEKGNNTPIVELYLQNNPVSEIEVGAGVWWNKTGSAPGTFNSGKHNDVRSKLYTDIHLYGKDDVSLDLKIQANYFIVGLTESGTQGQRTPNESHDIERFGWFVNPSVRVDRWSFGFIYEELDRADGLAFQNVAKFDKTHPVMNSKEKRYIGKVAYTADDLEVAIQYKLEDVPFYSDRDGQSVFGVTFTYTPGLF